MIRTYAVTYTLAGQDKEYTTRCVTQPRYNTNFESLRKMIAIKRGAKIDQVEIILLSLLSVEDADH